jgi:hypothetical protein
LAPFDASFIAEEVKSKFIPWQLKGLFTKATSQLLTATPLAGNVFRICSW